MIKMIITPGPENKAIKNYKMKTLCSMYDVHTTCTYYMYILHMLYVSWYIFVYFLLSAFSCKKYYGFSFGGCMYQMFRMRFLLTQSIKLLMDWYIFEICKHLNVLFGENLTMHRKVAVGKFWSG